MASSSLSFSQELTSIPYIGWNLQEGSGCWYGPRPTSRAHAEELTRQGNDMVNRGISVGPYYLIHLLEVDDDDDDDNDFEISDV